MSSADSELLPVRLRALRVPRYIRGMVTRYDYLRRLPRGHYQGDAFVHWSLTVQDRKIGWLTPAFSYKFRELLTHTLFRYGLTCPVYCLMPDHLHMLWIGLFSNSDQLNAMKFIRRETNVVLQKLGYRFQAQAFDNVLSERDRRRDAFEEVCEYIARNPERNGQVPQDGYMDYRYTDCLVPGAPNLHFVTDDFWAAFWRVYYHTKGHGLTRAKSP